MPVFVPYAAAFVMAVILSGAMAVIMKSTFFKKKGEDKSDRSLDSIQTAEDMLKNLRHQIALVQTCPPGKPQHQEALKTLLLLMNQAKLYFPSEMGELSRLILYFQAIPLGSDAYVGPLLELHSWVRTRNPPAS